MKSIKKISQLSLVILGTSSLLHAIDHLEVPENKTAPKKIAIPESCQKVKLSASDKRKHKREDKSRRHTLSNMSYEELCYAKDKRITEKDIVSAIRFAEKMIPMCKDMHELADLSIEHADLLFQNNELQKAGKKYQDFVALYPGNHHIEHAYYRAIICCAQEILGATHDQSKTKETLDLTCQFLERSSVFTKYTKEVKAIQHKCVDRLVDSELQIIEYFMNNKKFKAVENRIKGLKKDYMPKLEQLEPKILTMEINLAQAQNNKELMTQKVAELETKFPSFSSTTVLAQVQPTSMVDRF